LFVIGTAGLSEIEREGEIERTVNFTLPIGQMALHYSQMPKFYFIKHRSKFSQTINMQ